MKSYTKRILLLIILTLVMAFAAYPHLPNQIPLATGSGNDLLSFVPAYSIYIPTLVLLFVYSILLLIQPLMVDTWKDILFFCVTVIGLLCLICQLYFIGLSFGLHFEQAGIYLPLGLGLIIATIAPFIERSPISSIWNRLFSLPFRNTSSLWILKDQEGWRIIRGVCSNIFFLVGLLIIFSSFLQGFSKALILLLLILFLLLLPYFFIKSRNKH